jgi:hypothetical protein
MMSIDCITARTLAPIRDAISIAIKQFAKLPWKAVGANVLDAKAFAIRCAVSKFAPLAKVEMAPPS